MAAPVRDLPAIACGSCRDARISASQQRWPRARHAHHRPAGETLHAPSQDPQPGGCGRPFWLQPHHRRQDRRGSEASFPETAPARPETVRPTGCGLEHRDRADAAGPAPPAAIRRVRGLNCKADQPASASRAVGWHPAHPRAPRPRLAGAAWAGVRGDLPPGAPARRPWTCRTSPARAISA